MTKTRYAICGLSTRGIYHFVLPLLGQNWEGGTNFNDRAEIVGIMDLDRARVESFLGKVKAPKVPIFAPEQIKKMLAETKPDVAIVTGPDYTHADHAVAALEAGCDVIVEKPMVIDHDQIRRVRDAERASGKKVKVSFNYRYTPTHKKLKRLILDGKLGRITNVELIYNLDTFHGASYFYRWNRSRAKSGGLSIHKCCHHFDLVNWWIGDAPDEVFAFGALNYYGANGAHRPRDAQGNPLPPAQEMADCPYFKQHYAGKFDPAKVSAPQTGWDKYNLTNDAQYPPDKRRYIYDAEIDIEDTYSAVVRYRGGASLSYSCNFSTPWEGYKLGINGTKGRIEVAHHSNPNPTGKTDPEEEKGVITFFPLFGGKEVLEIPPVAGGHGGADFQIQNDLLGAPSAESKELKLVAGSTEGANAVVIGEAVWRSIKEHRPIKVSEWLGE